ncbi:hypothetical protein BG006_003525 [Podila minutissima]|uniref:Uncharacterized protein n=1 Tax=Podila minutissima TaxID=64525 RepID=A0A9P5VFV7_9FUNG|nr:hypothetical protein BG006_003525 [Podila minutissima]
MKLWYEQDNRNYTGQSGSHITEPIVAQAKKFKYYPGKSLAGQGIDEWIDSFEKWCTSNIGNPYTPGLDHEILCLFASACETIPELSKEFDNFTEIAPPAPSMQRYGYNVLACCADWVVLQYTRNLNACFRSRVDAVINTGLSYDTHHQAHQNIYAIQLYMEQKGEQDRKNHNGNLLPNETPIPAPAPTLPTADSGTTVLERNSTGSRLEMEMMDLVTSMDDLHLTEMQQVGVFHMLLQRKNQARPAGAPAINLAHAADTQLIVPPPAAPSP